MRYALFVSAVVLSFVFNTSVEAQEKGNANSTLLWDAPTTNVDGSPLTDLAGFEVGVFAVDAVPNAGAAPLGVFTTVDTSAALRAVMQLAALSEGQFRFAVLAFDEHGNKSTWSDVLDVSVKIRPPAPPTNLRCRK